MPGPKFAYFKGQIVPIEDAKVSVMTHALNYGTAAFGGMRGYWNTEEQQLLLFRPIEHFTRLGNSAKILMIDLPSPEELRDILVELLRREDFRENVYIRPLVYKSFEGIGVRLHDVAGDFTMFGFPYGSYIDTASDAGLHLGTSSWRRINDNMIPARGKISGAYANSALIKSEAVLNGYDEALVLNEDGHISEASAANVFIVRNGEVATPPSSADILEGIVRSSMITLMREVMGLTVVEREIDRTEIYAAQEVFLCGTGVQIEAATKVDHRVIGNGKVGMVATELRQHFFDAAYGRLPQYRHWTYPVYASEPIKAR